MANSSKSASKGFVEKIVDAMKKKPTNMADGRGAHVPTIRLGGEWKSDVEKALEQGFEVRSYPKTPNDTYLGSESRMTKETIKRYGNDAVRDSGVFERPSNQLGHRNPHTGHQRSKMDGFVWDKKGYAMEVPNYIEVPLYADKGVNLGIMKDVKKPEMLSGKTKNQMMKDLINQGRDLDPNGRAKARGEYVTKAKPSGPARTDSEVAEQIVGDLGKVGLVGGTAAGGLAVGRSIWSQKKDASRK
jgi:hypothetical protein